MVVQLARFLVGIFISPLKIGASFMTIMAAALEERTVKVLFGSTQEQTGGLGVVFAIGR